jgi:amidase
MGVTRPDLDQIARIASDFGTKPSAADLRRYDPLVAAAFDSYDRLDEISETAPQPLESRDSGRAPSADENPLKAWSWICSIAGAHDGPLRGKRISVKDNVAVAGLPMATAVPVPPGYIPEFDATVVRRCLAAGAEIVGKAAMSKPSAPSEAVRNPHDTARYAGASSGGSAVLVATGQSDLSIGTDQGGSVRIPAAWCGVYGLKPTYGLVPYTGIVPMELTLDHAGLLAANVADLALLLEVVAGEDGLDPRQNGVRRATYRESVGRGIDGIRIGILAEGFGLSEADSELDDVVRSAISAFEGLGADVRDVSIRAHSNGVHLFHAIHREGMASLLADTGLSGSWKGSAPLWPSLQRAFARGRRPAAYLPEALLVPAIAGEHMHRLHGSHFYAKAQALGRELSAAYDEAFESVDVLVMPTLPQKPPLLEDVGGQQKGVERAFSNMSPFNVTGHPALTVPCGRVKNLPVGMQLVGPRWGEAKVLQAAYAFENGSDIRP